MTYKKQANEFMRTSLGRLAGTGIVEDNYGEESFPDDNSFHVNIKNTKKVKKKIEEAPVKTYVISKDELKKYENGNK